MEITWRMAIDFFKVPLLVTLMKDHKMTRVEAIAYLDEHADKHSDLLKTEFDKLIKEHQKG